MMQRTGLIGTLMLGLAMSFAMPSVVSSARHFAQCFQEIQQTNKALSPVERVVCGLILTSTGTAKPVRDAAQAPRT